jgi:GNAT superfamily N-acetyltransferase
MIRQATLADAAAVRAVVQAAYQPYVSVIGREPAPMADDYEARIAAGSVSVLEADGEIAGVLVLLECDTYYLLDNVAVRPDRHGHGYGRLLLDFAEAEAARRGRDSIMLYTHALMIRNIAIYTARGFVQTDRRVEDGFDRVYMVKRLG